MPIPHRLTSGEVFVYQLPSSGAISYILGGAEHLTASSIGMTEGGLEAVDDLTVYLHPSDKESFVSTKLVVKDDVGRAVVAAMAFPEVGHVLIREKPVLVWSSADEEGGRLTAFLDRYLEAGEAAQAIILDMHTPPIESAFMQVRLAQAIRLCARNQRYAQELGAETVAKLIGVDAINSHEYFGVPQEKFEDVLHPFGQDKHHAGRNALFAYGSKVAHSCCPNVTYTSRTDDGCLEYKTTAPIDEGDLVTFPYIDNAPSVPTHLRRQGLMNSKMFFCECSRCSRFDFSRLHRCSESGCKGRVSCTKATEADDTQWTCTHCGTVDDEVVRELLQKESLIEATLDSVRQTMNSGGIGQVTPSMLQDRINDATRTLSRTHFLTLQTLKECSRLCASHAAGINQAVEMGMLRPTSATPYGSLMDLRLKSASAALDYVKRSECVAACCFGDCSSISDTPELHATVYACTVDVFHAFQDLKEISPSRWPEGSFARLQRYLPLCYIQFGPEDSDVKSMDKLLASLKHAAKRQERIDKKVPGKKKGKKGRKKK